MAVRAAEYSRTGAPQQMQPTPSIDHSRGASLALGLASGIAGASGLVYLLFGPVDTAGIDVTTDGQRLPPSSHGLVETAWLKRGLASSLGCCSLPSWWSLRGSPVA